MFPSWDSAWICLGFSLEVSLSLSQGPAGTVACTLERGTGRVLLTGAWHAAYGGSVFRPVQTSMMLPCRT